MNSRSDSTPKPSASTGFPIALAPIVAATMLLAGLALPSGSAGPGTAPPPFLWRDVALVCFLTAIPLAGALFAGLWSKLPARLFPPVGLFLLGAIVLAISRDALDANAWNRTFVSLCGALSLWMLCSALPLPGAVSSGRLRCSAGVLLLGFAALLILPRVYIDARCRRDLDRLADLLDKVRLGEAQGLATRILALDASAHLRDEPLETILPRLSGVLLQLQGELDDPLPSSPAEADLLQRAEALAILGRDDEALDLLEELPEPRSPLVANLQGTIHETRDEWALAQRSYAAAMSALGDDPESADARAELRIARLGMAVCCRKLGALTDAERHYLAALQASPDADTQFLLAQFYEDTQRSDRAHAHAREAMRLDPERFSRRGTALIDKLQTLHFGCFGAYREELRR